MYLCVYEVSLLSLIIFIDAVVLRGSSQQQAFGKSQGGPRTWMTAHTSDLSCLIKAWSSAGPAFATDCKLDKVQP